MDLSLPARAPNQERHHESDVRQKYAIYSLVPTDLQSLSRAINSAENALGTCQLAPRADFSRSQKLRDVYKYHLQLRDESSVFDPLYFIVAVDDDYKKKGLIVVYLNSSWEERNVVDIGRCGVDMAASWGMNLSIGNMDWEDLKEEEKTEFGTRGRGGSGEAGARDPTSASTSTAAAAATTATTQTQPRKMYGWYSLIRVAVPINEYFEKDYFYIKPSSRRIQMLSNLSGEPGTYVTHIRKRHPAYVAHRNDIHPQLLLVATEKCTSADAAEGVELVRLKWDGRAKGMEQEEAIKLNPEWETLERTKAKDALRRLDTLAKELGLQ